MLGWCVSRVDPNTPDNLQAFYFGMQGLRKTALILFISSAVNNGFSVPAGSLVGSMVKDAIAIIKHALQWAQDHRALCQIVTPAHLTNLPVPAQGIGNFLHLQMGFNLLISDGGYFGVVECYGLLGFPSLGPTRDINSSLATGFQSMDGFLGSPPQSPTAVANAFSTSGIPFFLLPYPETLAQVYQCIKMRWSYLNGSDADKQANLPLILPFIIKQYPTIGNFLQPYPSMASATTSYIQLVANVYPTGMQPLSANYMSEGTFNGLQTSLGSLGNVITTANALTPVGDCVYRSGECYRANEHDL